jgi:heme/copper-type cytochrome/quinol oxidase subunit 2
VAAADIMAAATVVVWVIFVTFAVVVVVVVVAVFVSRRGDDTEDGCGATKGRRVL